MIFPVDVFASDTYICSITEEIEAEFDKGKWINTSTSNGSGVFRVIRDNKKATVIEQGSDSDRIETSCDFVGGTIGYSCKEFKKITPYGESIKISFFPMLNEITIQSEITMRDMAAFDTNAPKNKKFFDDVRFKIKMSYGKCVEYH